MDNSLFSTKAKAYKEIQPIAKELGLKIFILDFETYNHNRARLESKMKSLGISLREIYKLKNALAETSGVVLFRSKVYYGLDEIAEKFDLYPDVVHYLSSKSSDKPGNEIWGSFDNKITKDKQNFFYWIDLEDLVF